jgi:hypothetical protein
MTFLFQDKIISDVDKMEVETVESLLLLFTVTAFDSGESCDYLLP